MKHGAPRCKNTTSSIPLRLWSSSTYFQPCMLTRPPVGAKTDSNSGGSICHRRPHVGGGSYRTRNRSIRLYKKLLIASPRDSFGDGVLVRWRRVACWRDRCVFCSPDSLLHDAVRAPRIVDCDCRTSCASEQGLKQGLLCTFRARRARGVRASAAAIQKETYQNSPF